jgi:flagellar basal-body rod modification protein FlgD
MSTTPPVDPAAAPPSLVFADKLLGKDDFLRLLVAKLENQNPLEPAEDTEFVAQLATFSSLEQLITVNDNLESLGVAQGQLINAQALTLIGKQALVESPGSLTIRNGVPDEIVYAMPVEAGSATLRVLGPDGQVVRTFELETTPQGSVTIDWDGTDEAGNALADGDYRIEVEAMDAEGEPLDVPVFLSVSIDAVHFLGGTIALISGNREIPFEAILEIRAGRG